MQVTPQERSIIQMLADGNSRAEIGSNLFISERTVKYHLEKLYRRANLPWHSAPTALVAFGFRKGLIR